RIGSDTVAGDQARQNLHTGLTVIATQPHGLEGKGAAAGDINRGQFAAPEDGTLIKLAGNPTVYWVSGGIKQPVTAQVFKARGLRYEQVFTVSDAEAGSWLTGRLLPPPDGALVKTRNNQTVYWVVGGLLHPINAGFFRERGLQVFPIMQVSEADLRQFPKGEPYIR
ncbi:MAG: hypothetical protein JNK33_01780, partial [Candidatus Doudnabacteria bacterium]|nr:hypothetical protein [Candidatus Doudnabacteria bacterium]